MITDHCQKIIDGLAGKKAIEVLIELSTDPDASWPDRKWEVLADINNELGTKYLIVHINDWVAGRAATPKRVKIMARRAFFSVVLNDDYVKKLDDLIT